MSEDEEGYFEVYKQKGLVNKAAHFQCPSPEHNIMSPAVLSTVWIPNPSPFGTDLFNVTVIGYGTTVFIQAIRCNGKPECWNEEDENGCGFDGVLTFGIGN